MAKQLLQVDSSILGDASVTRRLSDEIVRHLRQMSPDLAVSHRDLGGSAVPHLSGTYLAGLGAQTQHEPQVQHDLALGANLLEEFLQADIVVIGAPMYNFTIPTQLKAWMDRLLVAGKTFRYTETGSQGLVTGKRVIVGSSRGGFYAGTPLAALDHQETLLRDLFGFIGVSDLEFIRAEGVSISADQRALSLEQAQRDVKALRSA
jgi:FMN-dependent NADH-azoreductase